MVDEFSKCLQFVFAEEGGYSDTPGDSGGPTNYGITLATLSAWRGRQCTAADVRALTQAQASAIYRSDYWGAVEGDYLPPGLDLMTFDFGVTSGPGTSAILLQRVLDVEQDGIIGPVTLAAAECAIDVLRSRIEALGAAQADYYRSLSSFPEFGDGWLARTTRRQAAAMSLTTHAVPDTATEET